MSRRRAVGVVAVLVAGGGALLLTTRGAADRPKHSVASGVLRVESRSCGRTMLGSGFLVGRRDVLTAAHVVDASGAIALRRGARVLARGTIVGADAGRDLALIRLDRRVDGHVFDLSTRAPRRGDRVNAVGYPIGAPLVQAPGSVLGTASTLPARGVARRTLIETDAVVSPGQSGGPLLGGRTVVGIIDLSAARGTGRPSFAVSARDAAPLVARWRSDPEAVAQRPCRVALAPPENSSHLHALRKP